MFRFTLKYVAELRLETDGGVRSWLVTTGLDPVVHADARLAIDCRIKSGNDEQ